MKKMAKHAADIVAALTPPPRQEITGAAPSTQSAPMPADRPSLVKSIVGLVPTVGGGVAGAYLWKKHRITGGITGVLAGSVAPELLGTKDERTSALCALGTIGLGAGAVQLLSNHSASVRFIGWVGAMTAGVIASSFVSGTPMNTEFKRIKKEWTEG